MLFRIVIILGISLLSESYQTGICIKLELLNTEYGRFIAYLRSLFSWHCPLQIFCFFLDPKTRCSADWGGVYLNKRYWYVSRFQKNVFSRERLTFGFFLGFSWKLRHMQTAIPQPCILSTMSNGRVSLILSVNGVMDSCFGLVRAHQHDIADTFANLFKRCLYAILCYWLLGYLHRQL